MISNFRASFDFNSYGIGAFAPRETGVYYLGYADYTGALHISYIGKSTDIQKRLLEHFAENKWSDVTHFGFCTCSTEQEALQLEAKEINYWQPKYNVQGVKNY